ncbi:MAG: glycosyltransferase, partial [Proteobacteria bacterium]|nr:glycosyltransferase [Pseudomonadota bacterium]
METPSSPKLDICIVSWRTRDLLRAGLASVVDQPAAGRIIVVDNASDDGTAEMVAREFPSVHLLPNSRNLGFAAGNNQAIGASSSPFLLLLNPDTEVSPGALGGFLAAFAEHPRAGAVAAPLVFPDGSVQRSCRSFPDPAALFY